MQKSRQKFEFRVLAALAAFGLTALGTASCVNVTTPWVIPPQHYMLDGENVAIGGAEYRNQDALTNNITSNDVVITIEGYKVLEGSLSEGQTRALSGGHYKGHKVSAMCISKPRTEDWVLIGCQVFVDDRKAVMLSF
jgi:hypothetical protein